ncbi:MAG TPA: pyruvate kinase, partial [Candidatus Saccharimonadales bacterium]
MMSVIFKRTKILATVGPAVNSYEKIEALAKAGVNGFRHNFSHGSYEERDEQIEWIRKASKKLKKPVAILQDLQGPKIRLGNLVDNHLPVKKGDELVLDYAVEHDGGLTLPVQYNLADKVKVGEPIYIFDGKVRTTVLEIPSDTAVKVRVENDGTLMSRKGLNLPDTDFGGDILT